jgi:hypothetical protein
MSVETFIGNLSRTEKLLAMELIWRDLSSSQDSIDSPSWHDDIVRERLEKPASGELLGLEESLREIQGRRNEGKAPT